MKKVILFLVVSLFLGSILKAQYQSQNEILDKMIRQGMEDWQVPGLTALVVKDGEVVFKTAYGIKDIHNGGAVDEETLFSLASTTKAFIAISIGMLVDQGKLDWNDKVREHLSSFRLSDAYVTEDARVKDLLTHNLGIGNADYLWLLDSASTKETLERFQLADMTYPLRGGYTYQNIMYAIAGELIEDVSGISWGRYVDMNILKPLGMIRSVTSVTGIYKLGNYTTPHIKDHIEGVVNIPIRNLDQVGAAGAMWSCADDMARYVQFILNRGIVGADTLMKPATFEYIFKPKIIIPYDQFYPTKQLTKPEWTSYGLGWFQHDYKGEKLDFHTGSIGGLVAIAGVMLAKDVGVYVFANLDHAELRHAIMYKALDLYGFNDDSRNWHREVFDLYMEREKKSLENLVRIDSSRVLNTNPSLSIEQYVGKYIHEMYGYVKIEVEGDWLIININDHRIMKALHWHYDTFRTVRHVLWGQTMINFHLNNAGKVNKLEFSGLEFEKQIN